MPCVRAALSPERWAALLAAAWQGAVQQRALSGSEAAQLLASLCVLSASQVGCCASAALPLQPCHAPGMPPAPVRWPHRTPHAPHHRPASLPCPLGTRPTRTQGGALPLLPGRPDALSDDWVAQYAAAAVLSHCPPADPAAWSGSSGGEDEGAGTAAVAQRRALDTGAVAALLGGLAARGRGVPGGLAGGVQQLLGAVALQREGAELEELTQVRHSGTAAALLRHRRPAMGTCAALLLLLRHSGTAAARACTGGDW